MWKVSSKKRILILSFLLLISIFLSVYGALHSREFSKNDSYYSESNVQILTINNYSNRHVLESIGVVLFVVVSCCIRLHFIKKRIFFRETEKVAKRFLETGNQYFIEFSKEHVEYNSPELCMKINWIRLSNYKNYKDFIFVGFENYASVMAIDKRLLSPMDLDVLIGMFKSNDIRQLK